MLRNDLIPYDCRGSHLTGRPKLMVRTTQTRLSEMPLFQSETYTRTTTEFFPGSQLDSEAGSHTNGNLVLDRGGPPGDPRKPLRSNLLRSRSRPARISSRDCLYNSNPGITTGRHPGSV